MISKMLLSGILYDIIIYIVTGEGRKINDNSNTYNYISGLYFNRV